MNFDLLLCILGIHKRRWVKAPLRSFHAIVDWAYACERCGKRPHFRTAPIRYRVRCALWTHEWSANAPMCIHCGTEQ